MTTATALAHPNIAFVKYGNSQQAHIITVSAKRELILLGEELFENFSSPSNRLAMTAHAIPETRNFSGFEIVF